MFSKETKGKTDSSEFSAKRKVSGSGNTIFNLEYLTKMMGNKNNLILGIIDAFLQQIPEELQAINIAILKEDFSTIKSLAHAMKSSVSIMGILTLNPILQEMENFGESRSNIERVKELAVDLNIICKLAVEEINKERPNYC